MRDNLKKLITKKKQWHRMLSKKYEYINIYFGDGI